MKVNKKYIFITITLFLIELYIAAFVNDAFVNDAFIRPFIGDALVIVLLFSFARIFYYGKNLNLVIAVLGFAITIEILQYFKFATVLGLEQNRLARIILGSTFDWLDLLAYTIGALFCYFFDKSINKQLNQR